MRKPMLCSSIDHQYLRAALSSAFTSFRPVAGRSFGSTADPNEGPPKIFIEPIGVY